jgi:hypothetical protein
MPLPLGSRRRHNASITFFGLARCPDLITECTVVANCKVDALEGQVNAFVNIAEAVLYHGPEHNQVQSDMQRADQAGTGFRVFLLARPIAQAESAWSRTMSQRMAHIQLCAIKMQQLQCRQIYATV